MMIMMIDDNGALVASIVIAGTKVDPRIASVFVMILMILVILIILVAVVVFQSGDGDQLVWFCFLGQ